MWGSGRIVPSRADQGLDSVLFKHRSATGWQLFCTPHWLRLALKAVTESGFSGIILSECTTCGTLHRERSVNSASNAHCGDKAVQMIARSLCSEVNQLTSLDVQYKLLGEQAGIAIAKAMQSKHCKLTHLMISYLCLTSKAGMAFATALQSPHCQLEYLDLSFVWGASFMGVWGGLKEAAGLAVAQSLSSKHCKLTFLDVSHSGLSDSVGIAIATSFFTRTSRIRTLKVSGNGKHQHMSDTVFGVGAAVAMATALRSEWCKLTNLDISYNAANAAGISAISSAISKAAGSWCCCVLLGTRQKKKALRLWPLC